MQNIFFNIIFEKSLIWNLHCHERANIAEQTLLEVITDHAWHYNLGYKYFIFLGTDWERSGFAEEIVTHPKPLVTFSTVLLSCIKKWRTVKKSEKALENKTEPHSTFQWSYWTSYVLLSMPSQKLINLFTWNIALVWKKKAANLNKCFKCRIEQFIDAIS